MRILATVAWMICESTTVCILFHQEATKVNQISKFSDFFFLPAVTNLFFL